MYSQYHGDVFLSIATYTKEWLAFIMDPEAEIFEEGLSDKHMLQIKRIAHWDIRRPGTIPQVASVLGAIILNDDEIRKRLA